MVLVQNAIIRRPVRMKWSALSERNDRLSTLQSYRSVALVAALKGTRGQTRGHGSYSPRSEDGPSPFLLICAAIYSWGLLYRSASVGLYIDSIRQAPLLLCALDQEQEPFDAARHFPATPAHLESQAKVSKRVRFQVNATP